MNTSLPSAGRAALYDENGVIGPLGTEWLVRTYYLDQQLSSAVCFSPWPGEPVDGARFGIALLDDHGAPTWVQPVAVEVFGLRGAGPEGTLGWVRFAGPPRRPAQLDRREHEILADAMTAQPNLRSALTAVEDRAALLNDAATAQPVALTPQATAAISVPAWSTTTAGPAELSFSICRLFRWD